MNTQLAKKIDRFFGIIAIITAFYNAYLSWFKDEFSLTLLILTAVFILLSAIVQIFEKSQKEVQEEEIK